MAAPKFKPFTFKHLTKADKPPVHPPAWLDEEWDQHMALGAEIYGTRFEDWENHPVVSKYSDDTWNFFQKQARGGWPNYEDASLAQKRTMLNIANENHIKMAKWLADQASSMSIAAAPQTKPLSDWDNPVALVRRLCELIEQRGN